MKKKTHSLKLLLNFLRDSRNLLHFTNNKNSRIQITKKSYPDPNHTKFAQRKTKSEKQTKNLKKKKQVACGKLTKPTVCSLWFAVGETWTSDAWSNDEPTDERRASVVEQRDLETSSKCDRMTKYGDDEQVWSNDEIWRRRANVVERTSAEDNRSEFRRKR